ncbi:MAG: hypothetical protein AVDCRST_MAG20-2468, partial [uncultured Acidimicrobiales bacterium]
AADERPHGVRRQWCASCRSCSGGGRRGDRLRGRAWRGCHDDVSPRPPGDAHRARTLPDDDLRRHDGGDRSTRAAWPRQPPPKPGRPSGIPGSPHRGGAGRDRAGGRSAGRRRAAAVPVAHRPPGRPARRPPATAALGRRPRRPRRDL